MSIFLTVSTCACTRMQHNLSVMPQHYNFIFFLHASEILFTCTFDQLLWIPIHKKITINNIYNKQKGKTLRKKIWLLTTCTQSLLISWLTSNTLIETYTLSLTTPNVTMTLIWMNIKILTIYLMGCNPKCRALLVDSSGRWKLWLR